jgi:hypothetical protein
VKHHRIERRHLASFVAIFDHAAPLSFECWRNGPGRLVVSCLDRFDWWLLLGFLMLRRGGVLVVGSRLVVCNGSALFSDFPACETLACHRKRSRAGDVTVISLCDSVLQPGLTLLSETWTQRTSTNKDIPSSFDSAWTRGSFELLARAVWFVVLLGGHTSF